MELEQSLAAMARARLRAPAMLVGLLAVSMAATAAGVDISSICDTAKCGKGTCREVTIAPLAAGYNCTCDPGWSQPKLLNLTVIDWMPCMIPKCSFDSSCYNFSFLWTLPKGIPLPPRIGDPCSFFDCGSGGACENDASFSYQCRCRPGFKNLLDDTSMPCVGGSCTFGADCAKLGLVNTSAAPAPAPVGNDPYHY